MKLVRHEASAWTVGQLRKALADFPDDMPVRVAPLEEPGGDLEAPLQVVTNTGIRVPGVEGTGQDAELAGDYVTLECDYPSGEYAPQADEG
jgi:hypothetical protein